MPSMLVLGSYTVPKYDMFMFHLLLLVPSALIIGWHARANAFKINLFYIRTLFSLHTTNASQ